MSHTVHQVSSTMGQSQTHQANGAKVKDPGGATLRHETGGMIPG